jgi:hypothetical protein
MHTKAHLQARLLDSISAIIYEYYREAHVELVGDYHTPFDAIYAKEIAHDLAIESVKRNGSLNYVHIKDGYKPWNF